MEKNGAKIGNYAYILYKWRKFITINLVLITLVTTGIVFLLPNQYKATATVMIPPESQMGGLGGLTSLLGGKSPVSSMGSRLFGVSGTSEDVLLGIINSKTALTKVINKFNLMDYYEVEDGNLDKVIKAFKDDVLSDPNEYGMIEFSVINEDPKVCAEIANYMVSLVDSMNIELNIQNAKNNRLFIEKRYLQNLTDLRKAEDSLYNFQRKYGIVAVPEQLEVTIKAAAEIETELIKKEMQSHFTKEIYGENSPQYQGAQAELTLLKKKVNEIKSSPSLSSKSNILYSFKDMPDISIQYLRAFREVEIQQTVLEFVMPMYEQAKVEEQKSIPTIMSIDKATPPQLKYSPKRGTIIVGISFLSLFLFIPFVFAGEKWISKENPENILQIKTANFFKKMAGFYKLKL